MMTREDILQELELLPVWQLRAGPPPQKTPASTSETLKKAEDLANTEGYKIEGVIEKIEILEPLLFTHITSVDGDWLFVLANTPLQLDEALLMQNIAKAMRMNTRPVDLPSNTLDVIRAAQPKMIVAMGEVVAQAMLQSSEPLAILSGKLHKFQNIALVATYDLAHLLQNLSDKAKAWHDLRFAMQVLKDL